MSERELPARASLENLRKQAKALHRAFRAGDADAIHRIQKHLPKAAALSDADLPGLDLSLQEAQHVLAREYGFSAWEDLKAAIDVPFEAFLHLGKTAFHEVLREVDQKDLSRALAGAAENVREAFYACMSRRVALFMSESVEFLGQLPAAEVEAAQRTILDTARRVAADKGFAWPPEPLGGAFDDLARLTDRETQVLIREVAQLDLTRALIGAPEAVRGRTLSNMSRRVRTLLVEEGERLAPDLPDHEPAASRQRILEWAEALGADQRIHWPPPADREPWSGTLEGPGTASSQREDPLGGLSLEDLSADDLGRVFEELAQQAKGEGILSLEEIAAAPGPLSEGLRLIVDGTETAVVESMLETRTATTVRNRRLRLTMMREGVRALQRGTNPQLLWHQMQAHYLDPGDRQPSRRLNEAITGAELRDWMERGWLGTSTPAEIAELFLHLALAARNEGIEVLRVAAEATDEPLLQAALGRAVDERDDPGPLQAWMEAQIDARTRGLEARLRALTTGFLGIQGGRPPEEIRDQVRAAAQAD